MWHHRCLRMCSKPVVCELKRTCPVPCSGQSARPDQRGLQWKPLRAVAGGRKPVGKGAATVPAFMNPVAPASGGRGNAPAGGQAGAGGLDARQIRQETQWCSEHGAGGRPSEAPLRNPILPPVFPLGTSREGAPCRTIPRSSANSGPCRGRT